VVNNSNKLSLCNIFLSSNDIFQSHNGNSFDRQNEDEAVALVRYSVGFKWLNSTREAQAPF
jgi:hypothetical protein